MQACHTWWRGTNLGAAYAPPSPSTRCNSFSCWPASSQHGCFTLFCYAGEQRSAARAWHQHLIEGPAPLGSTDAPSSHPCRNSRRWSTAAGHGPVRLPCSASCHKTQLSRGPDAAMVRSVFSDEPTRWPASSLHRWQQQFELDDNRVLTRHGTPNERLQSWSPRLKFSGFKPSSKPASGFPTCPSVMYMPDNSTGSPP